MNIPRVTIIVRSLDGKIQSPNAADKTTGAIRLICDEWGFSFLMLWVSRFCLHMASENSTCNATADIWIDRYKKLRDIR